MIRATSLPDLDPPHDDEPAPPSGRRIASKDGSSAEIREADGRELIRISDSAGHLLFEYAPATGRAVLSVPVGNLVLAAPRGDVEIEAGGSVRMVGKRDLTFSGERGSFAFGETTLSTLKLSATIESARAVFGRAETIATQIVQRAKRVFRRVEDVDELTAGRSRSIIAGTYSLKSERAVLHADDDVKIDGKRIHLG